MSSVLASFLVSLDGFVIGSKCKARLIPEEFFSNFLFTFARYGLVGSYIWEMFVWEDGGTSKLGFYVVSTTGFFSSLGGISILSDFLLPCSSISFWLVF
jgi:hypothetical protein